MYTIYNLNDLLSFRGFGEETFAQLQRNVYKYTACGAYVGEFYPPDKPNGLLLSSIVEGVDDGTEVHCLYYPFKLDEFQNTLEAVCDEASEIWKATHGCDDCDPEMDSEQGFAAINPECLTCKGEGIII